MIGCNLTAEEAYMFCASLNLIQQPNTDYAHCRIWNIGENIDIYIYHLFGVYTLNIEFCGQFPVQSMTIEDLLFHCSTQLKEKLMWHADIMHRLK